MGSFSSIVSPDDGPLATAPLDTHELLENTRDCPVNHAVILGSKRPRGQIGSESNRYSPVAGES